MTTPCEIHDRLAGELLTKLFTDAQVDGRAADGVEIMMILESLVLGAALAIERSERTPRRVVVEMIELMTERVMERLGPLSPGAIAETGGRAAR